MPRSLEFRGVEHLLEAVHCRGSGGQLVVRSREGKVTELRCPLVHVGGSATGHMESSPVSHAIHHRDMGCHGSHWFGFVARGSIKWRGQHSPTLQ